VVEVTVIDMARIQFSEFLRRIPAYDVVEKYAERTNVLCGVQVDDLFSLPYWHVKKTIPDLIELGKYEEAFSLIVPELELKEIQKADNYSKASFYFWVLDQYKLIIELEKNNLKSSIDPKLINAGIKKMEVLGDFPLIDSIARDYNYTHDEAKMLPYETVFQIQLKNKIENDVNKKLEEQRK